MDVMIAFLKDVELPSGDKIKAGEVKVMNTYLAVIFINQSKAVYYSDFNDSMLDEANSEDEPAEDENVDSNDDSSEDEPAEDKPKKGRKKSKANSENEPA